LVNEQKHRVNNTGTIKSNAFYELLQLIFLSYEIDIVSMNFLTE